jgi:chemotaxis protein histidine kinase CheA
MGFIGTKWNAWVLNDTREMFYLKNNNEDDRDSKINDKTMYNKPQNISNIDPNKNSLIEISGHREKARLAQERGIRRELGAQVPKPIPAEDVQLPLKMIWIDRNFFQEIITRILEWIMKIEEKLLVMKSKPEDPSLCLKNRRLFQIIHRLADLVEADLIQEIARQTVAVLDKCDKNELKVNRATINWLLASTGYIKKLCVDFTLNYDPAFLAIAQEHLNRFPMNDQELAGLNVFDDTQIKRLGDILVEQKRLTQEELAELLAKQKEVSNKLKLGQIALSQEKIGFAELVESLKIQTDSIILSITDQETEYESAPSYLKTIPGGKKDDNDSPGAKGASHRKKRRPHNQPFSRL